MGIGTATYSALAATHPSTLDRILDGLPVAAAIKDARGHYSRLNQAYGRLAGLHVQDVLGRSDAELFGARAAATSATHDTEVLRSRRAGRWTERLPLAGGERELSVTRIPLFDSCGETEGVCVIIVDDAARDATFARLRENEQRFRDFAETAADWFWEMDAELRFTYISERFAEVLGVDRGSMLGKTREESYRGRESIKTPEWQTYLAMVEQHLAVEDMELPWPRENGDDLVLSVRAIPQFDAEGNFLRYRGAGRDITEHKRIEHDLREREASVRALTDLSPVGILRTDPQGNTIYVNPRCAELLDCDARQCLGTGWMEGLHRDDRRLFAERWQFALHHGEEFREELRFVHRDGSTHWVSASATAERDDRGRLLGFVGTLTDITPLKQGQEELQHLAHYDALTHLPNRLLLEARLEHAIQRARRNDTQLAVIFLDLDRFKFINDSMGHAAGDRLLQQVAQRLLECVRRDDTVARLGGDEFIMLIEDLNSMENATFVAEKVINALMEPVNVDGQDLHVRTSMGICLYPADGDTPETLLRNADAAMYSAKQAGRNGYHFYTSKLTVEVQERIQLETALRHAVGRDELRLMYQPQWSLYDDSLSGIEVLVRWQHPQRGLLTPCEFIGAAEETDLILQIGRWVRRTACLQASEWLERGLPLPKLAVNVAAAEIQQPGFTNELHRLLLETGLPAEMLELEVTENLLMKETRDTIGELERLRALGISLTIDDFGTGYSSLSYLKRLPIGNLKIDRSFVRDIPADPNDMAITRAIIALAESLGMNVVAEGVETREQRNFLRAEGCQHAQGFFFARPLTIDEMEDLLRSTL